MSSEVEVFGSTEVVETSVYASVSPKYFSTSLSCKTSTTFCIFNLGSLDQMGALLNANERAKSGASFKCGDILFDSSINSIFFFGNDFD